MHVFILDYKSFYSGTHFNSYIRTNGFSLPIHVYFILHCTVFILDAIYLFYFLISCFSFPTFYIILTLALFFTLGELYFTFFTLIKDPQDPNCIHSARNLNFVKVLGYPVIDPNSRICGICQVKVKSTTIHCKPCNKCVMEYDHHCNWLNTCIGKRNKLTFVLVLICNCAMALMLSSLSLYQFAKYWINQQNTTITTTVICFLFSILNIPIFIFSSNLLYNTEKSNLYYFIRNS
jgi:hypothetical protein